MQSGSREWKAGAQIAVLFIESSAPAQGMELAHSQGGFSHPT